MKKQEKDWKVERNLCEGERKRKRRERPRQGEGGCTRTQRKRGILGGRL